MNLERSNSRVQLQQTQSPSCITQSWTFRSWPPWKDCHFYSETISNITELRRVSQPFPCGSETSLCVHNVKLFVLRVSVEGKRPLGRLRWTRKDNIKMDIADIRLGIWIGFIWLVAGTGGRMLWRWWWTFLFHETQRISWLAEHTISFSRALLHGVTCLRMTVLWNIHEIISFHSVTWDQEIGIWSLMAVN